MKKLLRPVFGLLLRTLKSLLRFCYRTSVGYVKGYPNLKTIDFNKHHDEVHVLGNGPSMKVDKKNLQQYASKGDFYCVNNFCDDELYTTLKPVCYFFLDKYFYSFDAHPDWVARREKTFKKINSVTDWDMQIFIPYFADENVLMKHIFRENVKIIKVNVVNSIVPMDQWRGRFLLSSGLFTPPDYNVLIYAIFFSVWAKYKKVNIWGADLSFHKDVDVDQTTNDLVIKTRHFNEEDKIEVLKKNPRKIEKWKMSELLEVSSITFKAHELINDFASLEKIEVVNRSHYSLIDAYRRES